MKSETWAGPWWMAAPGWQPQCCQSHSTFLREVIVCVTQLKADSGCEERCFHLNNWKQSHFLSINTLSKFPPPSLLYYAAPAIFQFLTVKMENILWFSIICPGIKPCWVQALCGRAVSGAAPCHHWFWWRSTDLWSQASPFSQFCWL